MNLKRTERLIDAVKLIEILEFLENQEATLRVEKTQDGWEISCTVEGKELYHEQSGDLNRMAGDMLPILRHNQKLLHIGD